MSTEPVLINGVMAIIAAVLTPLLTKYGIDADGTAKILGLVAAFITAALAVFGIFQARSKVTPVVAPKTDTGVPLVPTPAVAPVAPIVPPVPPAPPAV